MSTQQFRLPDVGEGLTEADIVSWKVKPGDTIKVNDIVVEIETAKSLVELPSPFAGVVETLLVEEGATVPVGTPIIAVRTGDGVAAPAAPAAPEKEREFVPGGGAEPAVDAEGTAPEGERQAVLVGYGPRTTTAKRRPRKTTTPAPAITPGHESEAPPVPAPVAGRHATAGSAPAGSAPTTGAGPGIAGPATAAPGVGAAPGAVRSGEAEPNTAASVTGAAQGMAGHGAAWTAAGAQVTGASPGTVVPETAGTSAGAQVAGGRVVVLAKPPIRKLAKDLGVDLATVAPTGPNGTVTRDDVQAAASGGVAAPAPAATEPAAAVSAVGWAGGPREERIPVRSVRKVTAEAMVASAFTAPHVTEFVTVDVTRTMKLVQRLRDSREFRDIKLSPLAVLAKAMCVAVPRTPEVNATWVSGENGGGDEVVMRRYVNLGIAAATPRGLVVPNIKDAHTLTLRELAEAINDLATTAREGRTTPAAQAGGTISITNVGVFGVDTGTPILPPGEAAIVAFGAVREQPWVHKGAIKKRWVTTLALSFDHRLVDGEQGSRFLADVAALLEDPANALVWG